MTEDELQLDADIEAFLRDPGNDLLTAFDTDLPDSNTVWPAPAAITPGSSTTLAASPAAATDPTPPAATGTNTAPHDIIDVFLDSGAEAAFASPSCEFTLEPDTLTGLFQVAADYAALEELEHQGAHHQLPENGVKHPSSESQLAALEQFFNGAGIALHEFNNHEAQQQLDKRVARPAEDSDFAESERPQKRQRFDNRVRGHQQEGVGFREFEPHQGGATLHQFGGYPELGGRALQQQQQQQGPLPNQSHPAARRPDSVSYIPPPLDPAIAQQLRGIRNRVPRPDYRPPVLHQQPSNLPHPNQTHINYGPTHHSPPHHHQPQHPENFPPRPPTYAPHPGQPLYSPPLPAPPLFTSPISPTPIRANPIPIHAGFPRRPRTPPAPPRPPPPPPPSPPALTPDQILQAKRFNEREAHYAAKKAADREKSKLKGFETRECAAGRWWTVGGGGWYRERGVALEGWYRGNDGGKKVGELGKIWE